VANVKVIGGSVVNTAGVPLVSKTVTLKNDDTGTTITTTTTNADGEWEFPPRDETLRYRAEAAFGGSSSQVVVRKPASAEFDHLYANLSFRSAAGAPAVLGGGLTVTGPMTLTGDVTMTGTLDLGGDVTISGSLNAGAGALQVGDGSVFILSPLEVQGFVTMNTGLSLTGELGIVGGADVSGDVVIAGSLNVAAGALQVGDGAAFILAPLEVAGAVSLGGNIGFYGTAAQAKPTVTGSRGGNAALTSLLSALANLGLVVNSSS
jgi:hypothetical protein